MTEQVKDKVEDLEKKNLEEGEMPAALKAYIDKKGKKGEKEKEDDAEDDDGEDKKEVKEKKAKMKEDIDAIFSGEELSEEFKTNAKAIFEAAVASRVTEIETDLQEQFDTKLNEQVDEIVSGIVDKVDEYLEYVVTEWTEEHKVGIEKNLKAEVTEDFMVGLKNLFVENYIDIPEDKVDLVDEMTKKLQDAETDLDKKITENADLVAELNAYKKEQAVHTVTEGLSEIQIAKLKSLTKKKYFESKETEKTAVSESKKDLDSADSELEESFTPIMEHYVKNISKIVKR